jgi:hypothetical protein
MTCKKTPTRCDTARLATLAKAMGCVVLGDDPEGEWITVNGQHIFIKQGEDKDAVVKGFIDKQKPAEPKTPKPSKRKAAKKAKPKVDDVAETPKRSVQLPKNPKRMNIDAADAALKQMGYARGASRYDFAKKETMYEVTDHKGVKSEASAKDLRKLIYKSSKSIALGDAPRKPIIAVDLDKTILEHAEYPSYGKPRDGAIKVLANLQAQGFDVVVHTSRTDEPGVKAVLAHFGIPHDRVSCGKLLADVYIDDRALDARSPWSELEGLAAQRVVPFAAAF